jgi:hypothetical protein
VRLVTSRCVKTIESASALVLLRTATLVCAELGLSAILACGGVVREDGLPQDAAPGADTTSVLQPTPANDAATENTSTDGPSEGGDEAEPADAMELRPIPSPPPSDDVRLAGFAQGRMGMLPNGWDTCQGPADVRLCPSYVCDGGPLPSSGSRYFRYTGPPPGPNVCGLARCPDAQIYAYFSPAIVANQTQGLWFDLTRIAGDPRDATLTIYATDFVCETVASFGTWGLSTILSGPQAWETTCVNLTPSSSVNGIGFRFGGQNVDVGMDALRFGPACPP